MINIMRNILLIILIFFLGFVSKSSLENETITSYIAARYPSILLILFVLIVIFTAVFLLLSIVTPWYLKRKFELDTSSISDQEMISELSERLLFGSNESSSLSQNHKQNLAISRLGLWFMRREAISIYLSIIISIGGGIIGTATVYLLQKQNDKLDDQNVKLTLQTDATIVQSLLIEGTRRAALGEELTRILFEITSEYDSNNSSDEKALCTNDTALECWLVVNGKSYYRLSTGMTSRLRSYLDQATSYHYSAGAVPDPDFDKQLREQIILDYGSPERASIARRLDDLNISAQGLNFSGALLSQGQLAASDFRDTNFTGADLNNSVFSAANLSNSNFSHARLERADFRVSDMSSATLDGAILTQADLSGVNLSRATLVDANLTDAKLTPIEVKDIGLVRVNLRGANLNSATLTNTDLSGADMQNANLGQAILTDAILKGANLVSLDLRMSHLLNSNFSDSDMSAANFSGANMSGIKLDRTKLSSANYSQAWAWSDMAPSLPENKKITLCDFIDGQHERLVKPVDCETGSR